MALDGRMTCRSHQDPRILEEALDVMTETGAEEAYASERARERTPLPGDLGWPVA